MHRGRCGRESPFEPSTHLPVKHHPGGAPTIPAALFVLLFLDGAPVPKAMRRPLSNFDLFHDTSTNATAERAFPLNATTASGYPTNATAARALLLESFLSKRTLSEVANQGWCETSTGGTCLFSDCNRIRGPTVCSQRMWCTCRKGWCSNASGICSRVSTSKLIPASGPAWVRNQIYWVYYAAPVAVLARTDLFTNFPWAVLSLACCRKPKIPRRTFDVGGSWMSERQRYEYEPMMALMVATAKLWLFHLAQPLAIFLAFYSYSPLMDWSQWCLAIVVVSGQALYAVCIISGVILAPHFLLFQPFHDTDLKKKVVYMSLPHVFIAHCLPIGFTQAYRKTVRRVSSAISIIRDETLTEDENDGLEESKAVILVICCFVADCCAFLSLLLGFGVIGLGAMWPGLAAGYSLVFVSALPAIVYTTFF